MLNIKVLIKGVINDGQNIDLQSVDYHDALPK